MLRIGILGAASIAPRSVIEPAARRDDVVIAAVASRKLESSEAYAREHGIAKAYEGYEALLADPDIDLVYNALPPSGHCPWTIAALEAGKNVLCEKPFAMNAKEAQMMADAAKRTGRLLIEGFHYRFHPVFLRILELRDTGKLGRILSLDSEFSVPIPYSEGQIQYRPELGGGALMDLGCYPVHWTRTLMGSEPVVESANGTLTPQGVDNLIEAQLAFPDGTPARLRTAMGQGVPLVSLLTITCENGSVEVDNPVQPHLRHSIRERLNGEFNVYTVAGATSFDYQMAELVRVFNEGGTYFNDSADAIANMSLIDAIYDKAGFGPR